MRLFSAIFDINITSFMKRKYLGFLKLDGIHPISNSNIPLKIQTTLSKKWFALNL